MPLFHMYGMRLFTIIFCLFLSRVLFSCYAVCAPIKYYLRLCVNVMMTPIILYTYILEYSTHSTNSLNRINFISTRLLRKLCACVRIIIFGLLHNETTEMFTFQV